MSGGPVHRDFFSMKSQFSDAPLSDGQMKLILQSLESEIAEVKRIGIDTNIQAKKTNGRVNWLEKVAWTSMGALPLLTVWAGWLTLQELNQPPTASQQQIQSAVADGIDQALKNYDVNK